MHISQDVEVSKKNPFVLTEDSYTRDISPLKHYINQQAFHLWKMTGQPYDVCKEFATNVVKTANGGKAKNPTVRYLERMENGDREPMELPLTKYLGAVIKNEEILAPSGTTYIATKKERSVLSSYIKGNIKKRSIAKKAMFRAKAAGDFKEHAIQKGRQRNRKLSNNALSGAHAARGTPLSNKSTHSTLTSTCRMTSGQGNANNEKLIAGHRHYWKPDIAYNNIISIVQNTNYTKLEAVMRKYQLHYPTAEETMAVVTKNTNKYCPSTFYEAKIFALIEKLSPIERASFVYTGDLYHVKKYNDAFMREFVRAISYKVSTKYDPEFEAILAGPEPGKKIASLIHSVREEEVLLAHAICSDGLKGAGKDYEKMYNKGKIDELFALYQTAKKCNQTIFDYGDFIEVIMVSDNVPASVPHFPDAVREIALTSDTDSTIFTVEDWVLWYYHGENHFHEEAVGIANTMIYLASQAITHILARMSINMGVDRANMWIIAMKNEFYFPTFCPTTVSKHYFAYTYIQEGNVAKELEPETKGVHLKSSNAPKSINDDAQDMMNFIMDQIMANKPIVLTDLLKKVADTERDILKAITKGDARFTRRGSIKSAESYTLDKEKSNFNQYMLWRDAFSGKYGYKEAPPYAVVKLPGAHLKPADTQAWLATLEPEMRNGVKKWLQETGKDKMGAFMIPKGYVDQNGIPPEILAAINTRKIVSDISKVYYLVLGTLGLNILNDKKTVLLSDMY